MPKGRLNRRRLVALASAIVAAMFVSLAVAAPANAGATSKCSAAYVFIGVRGTAAPTGSGLGDGGRTWSSGGMGDQVDPLYQKWKTWSDNGGPAVWGESIAYPADGANYLVSENDGAAKLVAELNSLQGCLYIPQVIIAGHSQGAHVVLDALANPNLSATMKNQVKAVVAYGDASYRPGQPYNAPVNGNNFGLFPRTQASADVLAGYQAWVWGQSGQVLTKKILSICLPGDWACQQGTGPNANAIHNSYNQSVYIQWGFDHMKALTIDAA
jgi:hypothetical protein